MQLARMPCRAYCMASATVAWFTAALAGGVIGEVGIACPTDGRERRDVDDGAAALLQHLRNDGPRRPVDGADVQVQGGRELLLGQLDGTAHLGDADIVVQDVDAPEPRDRFGDRVVDRAGFGDVRRHDDGLAALLADDGGGFRRRLAAEIDAGDPRPFPPIGDGGGLAVAPAGARGPGSEHDGGLSLQTVDHGRLQCTSMRLPSPTTAAPDARPAGSAGRASG